MTNAREKGRLSVVLPVKCKYLVWDFWGPVRGALEDAGVCPGMQVGDVRSFKKELREAAGGWWEFKQESDVEYRLKCWYGGGFAGCVVLWKVPRVPYAVSMERAFCRWLRKYKYVRVFVSGGTGLVFLARELADELGDGFIIPTTDSRALYLVADSGYYWPWNMEEDPASVLLYLFGVSPDHELGFKEKGRVFWAWEEDKIGHEHAYLIGGSSEEELEALGEYEDEVLANAGW